MSSPLDPLADLLVHGQDIARPLRRAAPDASRPRGTGTRARREQPVVRSSEAVRRPAPGRDRRRLVTRRRSRRRSRLFGRSVDGGHRPLNALGMLVGDGVPVLSASDEISPRSPSLRCWFPASRSSLITGFSAAPCTAAMTALLDENSAVVHAAKAISLRCGSCSSATRRAHPARSASSSICISTARATAPLDPNVAYTVGAATPARSAMLATVVPAKPCSADSSWAALAMRWRVSAARCCRNGE